MTDLTSLSIAELRDGFRSGEFTAREIAEQYNSAVASARALNAYTVETPEDASRLRRQPTRRAEAAGSVRWPAFRSASRTCLRPEASTRPRAAAS